MRVLYELQIGLASEIQNHHCQAFPKGKKITTDVAQHLRKEVFEFSDFSNCVLK